MCFPAKDASLLLGYWCQSTIASCGINHELTMTFSPQAVGGGQALCSGHRRWQAAAPLQPDAQRQAGELR